MKFLHVSDIHLGKRLHGCLLQEDQEAVLAQTLALAAREDVDAVLIAGDVYNRAQPQPDAIAQFSRFLTRLAQTGKPTFIVRGNHDGEAQLAYLAPLLEGQRLYFSDLFDGQLRAIALEDAFGPLNVWLMPYFKPMQTRKCFPEANIESYADAVREVLVRADVDPDARNVLVTHHFVIGAQPSDSEERAIGGLDQVPAELFDAFDYVALGHLHCAQTLRGRLRYSGAPLVYSFDECAQQKSATIVEIGAKGAKPEVEIVPFQPLRRCVRLEGTLKELAARPRTEDYVQILLTDEVRPLDPVGTLRVTYPNLLNLQMKREQGSEIWSAERETSALAADPMTHFIEFYTSQNGHEPSQAQVEIIREILKEGGGET